jgi:hypothetical protein
VAYRPDPIQGLLNKRQFNDSCWATSKQATVQRQLPVNDILYKVQTEKSNIELEWTGDVFEHTLSSLQFRYCLFDSYLESVDDESQVS